MTRGQAANKCWHTFRKGVITASKGHDIKTKMEKIKCQGDLTKVNLWNIFQQISGLTFAPLKNGSISISVSRPTTQQAGNNELFGQSETPTLSG